MTKRNLTLGTASGRLGSVVYFRRRGQQIARVLVSSINDKRTLAQCRQRSRFANYVASWRRLRPYVENSWIGVSRYGSRENAFYKHNRGLMPSISKGMSRLGYAYPPLGLVTYGALPVTYSANSANAVRDGQSRAVYMSYVPYPTDGSAPVTTADFSKCVLAGNFGLLIGDIVHFLFWSSPMGGDESNVVALGEEGPPIVRHSSITLGADAIPMTLAVPWWNPRSATLENGERVLELTLRVGYEPPDSVLGYSGWLFCVWVERPSNPQFSRFSRSRFTASIEEFDYLRELVNNTSLSDVLASTFRNM